MSKTHGSVDQDDLDAQLDQFIATRKVKPVVASSPQEGIDLFGSGSPQKKKSIRQHLMSLFNRLTIAR